MNNQHNHNQLFSLWGVVAQWSGSQVQIPLATMWRPWGSSSPTVLLQYNCICTAKARKCTPELGMYEEEGRYQWSVVLYCI